MDDSYSHPMSVNRHAFQLARAFTIEMTRKIRELIGMVKIIEDQRPNTLLF